MIIIIICVYIYIYIYIHSQSSMLANNHVNNLQFKHSLETKTNT